MKKLSSNAAFSMVELMTVVAIIGVLAAVGIPKYSKMQSKARQAEAKMALTALFTAEESFRQEWNQFSVDLRIIGFSVLGSRLRYVTGFGVASGCTSYTTGLGAPTESAATTNTWSDGSNVNLNGATWAASITKPTITTGSCATTTFTAVSYGNPAQTAADPGSTTGDTWTITNNKLIANTNINLGN